MAKQKFRPTRPGAFSGAKAYDSYIEVLKKQPNAVGRTFCDAIKTNCGEYGGQPAHNPDPPAGYPPELVLHQSPISP